MTQDTASRHLDKFTARFPDGMLAQIKAEAEKNDRSMNGEIVSIIRKALAPANDKPFLQAVVTAKASIGMSDGEINDITYTVLGKWPSFEAQSWACKVVHAVLAVQFEQLEVEPALIQPARQTVYADKVAVWEGSIWAHRNGNQYRVVTFTNTESEQQDRYPTTVVYENVANGKRYSRPLSDWCRSMSEVKQLEMITINGREYRRFIRCPELVTDGTHRCIRCGQIDEEPYHDNEICMKVPSFWDNGSIIKSTKS